LGTRVRTPLALLIAHALLDLTLARRHPLEFAVPRLLAVALTGALAVTLTLALL